MKTRLICTLLCAIILVGLLPTLVPHEVHAATASQNNIVARADYMYNITWTAKSTVYGWKYNYTFSAGSTYRIPYGQPVSTGAYIGYGVSVDDFITAANTAGSVFYTSRSSYSATGSSSVYYANDCSAFVSWCWGTSRMTTYSIPQASTYIGMATASNAYSLQLGDCLNSNDVGHVVLVTDLIYNSSGTLTSIEITEQTPPQLKRSYYTPSELGAKYGSYYGIYRYYGTVPAAPSSSGSSSSGSSSSGTITTKYYPACASSCSTLYEGLTDIGVTMTWDLQCEIAEANGITDFSGTAEQNNAMLALLKAGKLIMPGSGSADDSDSSSGDDSSGSSGTGTTGYDRGYTGGMAGSGEYKAFGLDVSSWQGSSLDFARIKNAGYDYVILRAGSTKGKDTEFENYYTKAKAAGLDVGAYYYSYATTVSAAEADADDFLSYIAGKKFEYPVYFDYEDETQQVLSASLSQQICLAFMDKVAAEGYLVGMYTSKWFSTQLPVETICAKYEIWIAHYLAVGDGEYDGTNDYTTYGPTYASQYGMYQFTNSVWISGYGPYDGDVCYKDYPSIVKTYGFNGYEPEQSTYLDECTYYPSHCSITTTKSAPINSLPCSVNSGSTTLETVETGTSLIAIGLYRNAVGNLWYKVKTSSGEIGYVSAGRVTYVAAETTGIKLTNYDTPNGHVKGNVFNVTGTVKSSYSQLDQVSVSIYSCFGTSGTKVTGGSDTVSNNAYVLDGSTVDTATAFGGLGTGKYTYVISASYTSYYAASSTEFGTKTGTKKLNTTYFVVISSAVSQSSCSHSYSTTVVKAATCTANGTSVKSCSTCGLTSKITVAASHSYTYSGTGDGNIKYTCSACGNSYTEPLLSACTFYPSYCQFKTSKSTPINTLPCSAATTFGSETLETAAADTTYTAIGMYKNVSGNFWYQIKTGSGQIGYIYSGHTTYINNLTSDINLTNYDLPNGHVQGNTFNVTGTIQSSYNQLTEAEGYVYSGFGTSGTKVTGGSGTASGNSYVLDGSNVNNATAFSDLGTGKYTYVISASYTSYYAKSATELGTNTGTKSLNTTYFVVIPAAADQASCSHSYSTTVITAATCTTAGTSIKSCSQCGLVSTITVDASHSYGDWTTTVKATCTTDGTKTRTCSACSDVNTATIPATGHTWGAASCTAAATCTTCGATTGSALGHSYSSVVTAPKCMADGYTTHTCTTCGNTYKDSYVTATGHSWVAATCTTPMTCSACNTTAGSALGHSYANGKCATCGEADPNYTESVVVPTLGLVGPTLNFEDEIYYNIYYTVSDMTDVVELGLVTFNEKLADGTVDNALEVIPGYTKSGSNYMSHTNGIPAKMLSDALYFRVYAKLSDGSYVYSSVAGYHAVAYARDILANSTNAKMKALVVAMLNYGAAAQTHFDYKADSLMNSFLTDAQQALISEYSSDMVDSLVSVSSSKVGAFNRISGSYSALAPAVSFDGAFSINYYFTPAKDMDGVLKLYYWTLDDYNAADVLTTENASGMIVMEGTSTAGQYVGAVSGIAAKQIDETIFVCGVYECDGVSYPTGVLTYSLGAYCQDRIAKGTATMQEFAKATAVYGYYAEAYFA